MSGQTFGRYEIIRKIARGGMATIYQAHDPSFNRDVALKVLPPELTEDPSFLARFEREAQTIAALEHPAIVPVYDFGKEAGQPFIVMRFMAGGSLEDRLRSGPLDLPTAQALVQRIAGALDHAHARGVIHRDLKPANILFDQFGEGYLGDFGIARFSEATGSLTGTGKIIGTPAYMSPEQLHGDVELDGRSDVYALGVVLFEMLSGQQPFQSDTPAKLMMKHLLDPVPPIRQINPGLPPAAESLVRRAMAKTREERFPTVGELARELAALGEPVPVPASAPSVETSAAERTLPSRIQTPPPPPAPSLTRRRGLGPWLLGAILGVGAMALLIAGLLLAPTVLQVLAPEPSPFPSVPPVPTPAPTLPPPATRTALPAASPTPVPEFLGLQFCDRPCDSPGAVPVASLPEGATAIYASWAYQGMRPGLGYVRTWSVRDDLWVRYECEWNGPANGTFTVTLREPSGLRSGPWTIWLQIEDQSSVEATLIVEGDHPYWDPPGSLPCEDFK